MANPSSFVKVLTILVLILMVHDGETLKCWYCESGSPAGTGCDDPFKGSPTRDRSFTHDCGSFQDLTELLPDGTRPKYNDTRLNFFCYKLTVVVLGRPMFKRGCVSSFRDITATSCMDWKTQMTQGPLGRGPEMLKIETCDVCTSELCNGATNNVVGTIVILFATFLLVLT